MSVDEWAERCRALERRGLGHQLASDLFWARDERLLCDIEDATDSQLQALTEHARRTRFPAS